MSVLSVTGTATLALVSGVVTGQVTLGPGVGGERGTTGWKVTGVIVRTSRPGVAPIPRVTVVDQLGVDQGVSYDGSFDQGPCDINLVVGQFLVVTWTGGLAGDTGTVTLSGTR